MYLLNILPYKYGQRRYQAVRMVDQANWLEIIKLELF